MTRILHPVKQVLQTVRCFFLRQRIYLCWINLIFRQDIKCHLFDLLSISHTNRQHDWYIFDLLLSKLHISHRINSIDLNKWIHAYQNCSNFVVVHFVFSIIFPFISFTSCVFKFNRMTHFIKWSSYGTLSLIVWKNDWQLYIWVKRSLERGRKEEENDDVHISIHDWLLTSDCRTCMYGHEWNT